MKISHLVPFVLTFLKFSCASAFPEDAIEPDVKMAVVCNYTNFKMLITVSWAGKVRKSEESYRICLEIPTDDDPSKTIVLHRFAIEFGQSSITFPPRNWADRAREQVSIVMYQGKSVLAALDGVVLADICSKFDVEEEDEYAEEDNFKKVKYFTY